MPVMEGLRVTRRQLQIGALVTLVVLLVGGQLLLPWIGARVVRSKLGDPSAEVTVKAFPAWKMVLGKVDSVDVRSAGVQRSDDELSDLLERSKDVGRITSVVQRMTIGGLELRDVRTRIENGRLQASATMTLAALRAMAPAGTDLTVLPDSGDGVPRFEVAVTILGVTQRIGLAVTAEEGQVVVAPDNALGAVFRLTIFENPKLLVEQVTSRRSGQDLRLDVTGSIR